MDLQTYAQEMRSAIECDLQQVIDQAVPAEYPDLRAMLTYHMGWEGEGAGPEAQGKRIRPLLVLLSSEAAGGTWRQALPAASAVELLHNFSLVHDDVQDNSPVRRSRATVWVKWGVPQAINAGDTLFTVAFLTLQRLVETIPAPQVIQANRVLQKTCLYLTQGQYLDLSYKSRRSLPLEAYWPMVGGKTSALLSCCTELGALVAGVQPVRQKAFGEYGYTLGLAFQVLDDWLGIWGDVALTGKSVESDLASGKKTLPVLYGLSQNGHFAQRWQQGNVTPEEVPDLAQMLREEGAYDYTLTTAQRLTDKALDTLNQVVEENDAAYALVTLTRQLLQRKY